jgi:hypothetical protein
MYFPLLINNNIIFELRFLCWIPAYAGMTKGVAGTQPGSVNANQTDLSSRNDNFNETASQTRIRLPRRFAPRNDGRVKIRGYKLC